MMVILIFLSILCLASGLSSNETQLSIAYFKYKNVKLVSYITCDKLFNNNLLAKMYMEKKIRMSLHNLSHRKYDFETFMVPHNTSIGLLVDGKCNHTKELYLEAAKLKLFDSTHSWLVFPDVRGPENDAEDFIDDMFADVELYVNADIVVPSYVGDHYKLTDVYNFGRIQGNPLEKMVIGAWEQRAGLVIYNKTFKYYQRWDFHNLTLRAVSVILEPPKDFYPEILTEMKYTPGIVRMTKIASLLLNILKEQHNFRFNYTIRSRWIGSPERNSTPMVSNALLWGDQDIASTSGRIFPKWLDWMDIFYPPVTHLETKFYYMIPDKGIGDYENRFLTPMSPAVWWCSLATAVVCIFGLAAAAMLERRPSPGIFAIFSVFATTCQQDFEDGAPLDETVSSQGRRAALLVVGLTSMLLYNYYTSSVVSWLLNAAAPSISDLDGLMNSDFELIFEDIGYTRGWFDNPGLFYFSGFKNPKEDILRDKRVLHTKRKLPPLQPVEKGIELVRTGQFAYHTEPFTASQVISRTFKEQELCELGGLPIMLPANAYMYGQRRSPYKKFFVWSLMRLLERGHIRAAEARFSGTIPPCSGRMPRSLALGQAAPAFVLLAAFTVLSVIIAMIERIWFRYRSKTSRPTINRLSKN
ncbi:ionotropic receptor 75a-like [Bombyx mandarina]|uniref:Ionotropic receptor 75a-like n=1 Tax=Bombyx mandarina TaxID=7092 RepID=A0A6J2K8J8_BOMMA|nr:ionotropic receptor 75a-like [Bombyx mandarina]